MYPILFKIPGLGWPINSYGFSIMVGFLLASWFTVRRAKPFGIKSDFILDVGIIGMIFGIVGAKINFVLQYSKEFTPEEGRLSILSDMGLDPLGALVLGPIPLAFWWWRNRGPNKVVKLYSWQSAVLLFLTLLFALVGTRALYLYMNRVDYSWKILSGWQSGFVLYGGLIAGFAASALYVKMRGESIARMADLGAGPMMLAVAFGRLGCFLNGCCYGGEGSAFTCIRFPRESPVYRSQGLFSEDWSRPVHPTQLYETVATAGMFLLLSWIGKRKRKAEGEVFLMMMMMYGAWRFCIEFARADDRPTWIGTLSYSQVMSVGVFLLGGIWLYLLRSRPSPSVPPPPVLPPSVPSA